MRAQRCSGSHADGIVTDKNKVPLTTLRLTCLSPLMTYHEPRETVIPQSAPPSSLLTTHRSHAAVHTAALAAAATEGGGGTDARDVSGEAGGGEPPASAS